MVMQRMAPVLDVRIHPANLLKSLGGGGEVILRMSTVKEGVEKQKFFEHGLKVTGV